MTPADFRNSLKRQGLTQYELGNLVYAGKNRSAIEQRVSRWANGLNKVPGGVQAFLELREGKVSPFEQLTRDGEALLAYCTTKGMTYRGAIRALGRHLVNRKYAQWRNSRYQRLKRRLEKWEA